MMLSRWPVRSLPGFVRRSDGAVTIEFVLWIPLFFSLIMLSADTSMLFLRQSNFWSVSRETARIVARHGLDVEAASAWAAEQARIGEYRPEVEVTIDPIGGTVSVRISGKASALAPLGMVQFALNDMVSAEVVQVLEPI